MLLENKAPLITELSLYAGFGRLTQVLLRYWRKYILEIGDRQNTLETVRQIDRSLLTQNVVVFFDHHYAFDALPAALALGQMLNNIAGALIPYAVHLDMGVNRQGQFSLRYQVRTRAFRWLVGNIRRANPSVHFFPVVREFELGQPGLKRIIDERYSGANTSYLKNLAGLFSRYKNGLVCLLSPMAGIAFPGKAPLHPQVYRSMEILQGRSKTPLPFYFVGAYPRLHAHYHYAAPLLTKHHIAARGPFYLPRGNYEEALALTSAHLVSLRQAADFSMPDHARISRK